MSHRNPASHICAAGFAIAFIGAKLIELTGHQWIAAIWGVSWILIGMFAPFYFYPKQARDFYSFPNEREKTEF